MTADDHAALVALGKKMATTNGYTPMQSSSLYVTDGDEIDWAYGLEHIFMYTFEMYPSHSKVSSTARFYPADELIAPQTERNKAAILHPHRRGRLPVRAHRQGEDRTAGRCTTTSRRPAAGSRNPLGTDSAQAAASGSAPTRPRPAARRGPSRPARGRW